MLKISQKMGGLPSELSPVLQKIEAWTFFFLFGRMVFCQRKKNIQYCTRLLGVVFCF